MPIRADVILHRALDDARIHGDTNRRECLRRAAAAARCGEATRRDCALCHDVDLAVARSQRCLEERSAAQALRVTDGGDRHIEAVALAYERRKRRRHHDGSHVLQLDGRRIDIDAVADKHIGDGLHRLARA